MKMANYKEDNSSRKAYVQTGDQSKGGKNRKPFILTIFVIIGLIVLIALGCLGYYQYGKAKQEQQILKKQLEIWNQIVENNLFVICKTPMARSITKRTLFKGVLLIS